MATSDRAFFWVAFRILILTLTVNSLSSQTSIVSKSNLDYIDPTIGNVAPLLNTNRPIVHLPNQMVRVFPRRQDHLDMQITDFPMLALNVITPQMIFGIKPSTGAVTDTGWYRRLNYDHDFETTQPWYYSVLLPDDSVLTEYTAGERTGIYRFTFPKNVRKNLLLSHYYPNGSYEFGANNSVTGTEIAEDVIHDQKGMAYFYGEFTESPEKGTKDGEKDWGKYTVSGRPEKAKMMNGQRAWVSYGENSTSVIEFRYGVSFISIGQAKISFQNELKGISFQQLKEKGKSAWRKVIDQVKVEGGSVAQRRSFYTSLYRCYARMTDISEGNKYFSGYDKKVHENNRHFYTDDYTWGNYLALHPLRTILDPERQADMLQSYVNMYEESGWMPEYPKHFGDRPGMFGFKSSVMFLDAYRKGVRNFNVNSAFEGMLKNTREATMLPFRNGPAAGLEAFYDKNGYYPGLPEGTAENDSFAMLKKGQKRSSVAITLGDSYDSWALSQLAMDLGKTDIQKQYAPRAQNYKKLWWDKYNMFMPKDAAGNWIEIDPKFGGGSNGFDYFNENNGWSFMWNVQQDIRGLSELMGGPEKMEQNLDQLFREGLDRSRSEFFEKYPNQTGLIGQFAIGNQVTFFIPYLFNYTNAPWKTQKYTRLILDTYFKDNIFGVPGDEDAGSMSAFVVFSAMGFYPVTPGIPVYTITSPLFSKVSLDLHNGKKFTITASNLSPKTKYIQSATLNGKKMTSLSFTHEELMKGGTLHLEMGAGTNAKWEIKY